ncbi:ETC complex I subunit [Sandaracinobacteroides sp. A072]|uniref:ETC complex I subunit n=1 Tax=Sandaracinobacteroides sp. A072 TaxID=3461146 RepID=UPI0040428E7D
MAKARIFQQGTPATQSGKARAQQWILEREPAEAKRPDPLMGWAGSGDTDQQIRLTFPTLEAAKAYAERHGLDAEIVPPAPRRLILQSYAENFR